MLSFRNLSFRRKQTLIIMLTSSIVLLLTCAAFSLYEVIAFRNTMKHNLTTLADIVDHLRIGAYGLFSCARNEHDALVSFLSEVFVMC